MKQWPKDPSKVLPLDKLITPITVILRQGYNLPRTDRKGFVYKGHTIGKRELAHCVPPNEVFSARGVTHAEGQGRDLLDEALRVAFQLGVEHGRRIAYRDLGPLVLRELLSERKLGYLEGVREANAARGKDWADIHRSRVRFMKALIQKRHPEITRLIGEKRR